MRRVLIGFVGLLALGACTAPDGSQPHALEWPCDDVLNEIKRTDGTANATKVGVAVGRTGGAGALGAAIGGVATTSAKQRASDLRTRYNQCLAAGEI